MTLLLSVYSPSPVFVFREPLPFTLSSSSSSSSLTCSIPFSFIIFASSIRNNRCFSFSSSILANNDDITFGELLLSSNIIANVVFLPGAPREGRCLAPSSSFDDFGAATYLSSSHAMSSFGKSIVFLFFLLLFFVLPLSNLNPVLLLLLSTSSSSSSSTSKALNDSFES